MALIKVGVRFFTTLREISETGEVEITLPEGSSVVDLLEKVADRYGIDFEESLFDAETGKVRSYLQIIVNGKYISPSEGDTIVLNDRSEVVILPPLGGG